MCDCVWFQLIETSVSNGLLLNGMNVLFGVNPSIRLCSGGDRGDDGPGAATLEEADQREF